MYLRCSQCHAPTWIRSLVPGTFDSTVACAECDHEHDLSRAEELGRDNKSQHATAQAFADQNGVDLPTAYSVLLGLVDLDAAREHDAAQRQEARKAAAPTVTPDPEPAPMPQRPRAPRGARAPRRQAEAPPNAASNVTIHVERESAEERKRLTVGQFVLITIFAALVIGLTFRHATTTMAEMAQDAREAEKNTIASAEAMESAAEKEREAAIEAQKDQTPEALRATVERDEYGRVIRVEGPNPQTVLDAYCDAMRDGIERKPLGIAQASPPDASERFGVFQDYSRLESDHAIRISRDRDSRRWVAGTGRGPITTRRSADSTPLISALRR